MQAIPILIIMVIVLAVTSISDNFEKGNQAIAAGHADAAILHYTKALEAGDLSRHNRARALNNRAVAYDQKGLFSAALSDYDAAIRLVPDDFEIQRNRGLTMQKAGFANALPSGPVSMRVDAGLVAGEPRLQEKVWSFGFL